MAHTVPPARSIGNTGHVADHNAITEYLRRGPVGDIIDVRDHGALGDGSDDSAAIQAAVTEAAALTSATVMLGKFHAFGSTVVVPRGMTIMGGGSRATRLEPLTAFDGWMFSCEGNGRNGQWSASATTHNPTNDQSGVTFKGFIIDGRDRANPHKGIRVQRDDDFFMDDVQFGMIRGTALQLGAESIVSGVGSVRESDLRRIKFMHCGDEGGVPAFVIQNAPTGTGDGTNQVYIEQMHFAYNQGGIAIRNHHTSQTLRRVTISNSQIHGWAHTSVGTPADHDLVSIEGGVNQVMLRGCNVNSTGTAPKAIIRCKSSAVSGRVPQGLQITDMDAVEMVGDVIAADNLSDLRVSGRMGIGTIDGAVLRVGASAGLLTFDVQVTGAVNPAGTTSGTPNLDIIGAKFVVPATFQNRGVIKWGGLTVTPVAA